MKASYNGTVLAESNTTEVVEGNHYFPPESLNEEAFSDSDTAYHCPWKGDAQYHHVTIAGEQLSDAAWSYPNPKEAARNIAGYVAFDKSKGIVVE